MKSFKEYIKEENTIGSIPFPIHFKYVNKNTGTIPSAINFKYVVKEAAKKSKNTGYSGWLKTNDNSHFTKKDPRDISDILHKDNNFTPEHKKELYNYVDNSNALNKKLIKNKGRVIGSDKKMADNLDAAIDKNPIKHDLHVYSGAGFDPREHIKNGKMHSPAYLSTTHFKSMADEFAYSAASNKDQHENHIIHIHLKKGDPATHISKLNPDYEHEHETLIKRGVTLKHHGTESHTNDEGDTFHIHHMSIIK